MTTDILFHNSGSYLGANGSGWMQGMRIQDDGDRIILRPINSRGPATRAYMRIDKREFKNFVDELQKFI